jgi:serine protease Do
MGSVTSGIISGLNRTLQFEDGKSMKLIQTDAAINPGNSGGALLNSEGKVIGINSSKIGGEGYEGLGFAIPSNTAKEIAESLIQSGYVKGRPKLGISVDPRFNKDIAAENKVPEGVLVYDVEPLSGAYKSGIKSGDIITKLNGVEIKSFDELEAEKNKCKAGDKVQITFYRIPDGKSADQGETKTVEVVLGEDMG